MSVYDSVTPHVCTGSEHHQAAAVHFNGQAQRRCRARTWNDHPMNKAADAAAVSGDVC